MSTVEKKRRPKAIAPQRLFLAPSTNEWPCLDETFPDGIHTKRLRELMDELKRSLNGRETEE